VTSLPRTVTPRAFQSAAQQTCRVGKIAWRDDKA
jgi:hypothetical protein